MIRLGQRVQDLLFQLHLKQERIDALESGEEYIRMEERLHRELAYQDRIIKDLQKENAEKDRQITENRKHWEEVYDDVIAENDKKLAEKDKIIMDLERENQVLKEELAAEKAKFAEAKKETYAAQTELAEAQEQNAALQARLNKDYTNSSIKGRSRRAEEPDPCRRCNSCRLYLWTEAGENVHCTDHDKQ